MLEDETRLTKHKLVRYRIPHHRGCQTNSGRTFTSGIHTSRRHFRNVLQQLGLGHSWISHEADVDISSNLHPVAYILGDTTDKKQQKSLLDILMPVDLRSDTNVKRNGVSERISPNKNSPSSSQQRHSVPKSQLMVDLGVRS